MIDTYEARPSSGLVARDDRRLSVKEAAARAGVSAKTVRRKIDAGDLAGYRVRGTNRIVLLDDRRGRGVRARARRAARTPCGDAGAETVAPAAIAWYS